MFLFDIEVKKKKSSTKCMRFLVNFYQIIMLLRCLCSVLYLKNCKTHCFTIKMHVHFNTQVLHRYSILKKFSFNFDMPEHSIINKHIIEPETSIKFTVRNNYNNGKISLY